MTVHLTHDEAIKMIHNITERKEQAVQKLRDISHAQDQMLGSNWHGDSATKYRQTSDHLNDEFKEIVATLTDTIQTASGHLTSISSADQG